MENAVQIGLLGLIGCLVAGFVYVHQKNGQRGRGDLAAALMTAAAVVAVLAALLGIGGSESETTQGPEPTVTNPPAPGTSP